MKEMNISKDLAKDRIGYTSLSYETVQHMQAGKTDVKTNMMMIIQQKYVAAKPFQTNTFCVG